MVNNNPATVTELVRKVFSDAGTMGDFRPCVIYNKELDVLTIMEKDCSFCAEPVSGSNISILRNNYGDKEVVGVEIGQWSLWLKDL